MSLKYYKLGQSIFYKLIIMLKTLNIAHMLMTTIIQVTQVPFCVQLELTIQAEYNWKKNIFHTKKQPHNLKSIKLQEFDNLVKIKILFKNFMSDE